MRAIIVCLAVLCGASALGAEETREWDIRGLTYPDRDVRAVRIGFAPAEGRTEERWSTDGETILEWIRETVNVDGWDGHLGRLELRGGILSATAGAEDIAAIGGLLEELKARAARTVALEVEILEVASGAAAGLTPGALEDKTAEGLRASARVLHRLVARASADRYGVASSLRRRTYVADFDIEIAQHATVADPVVRTLLEGSILEFRPHFAAAGDALSLELLFQAAHVAELTPFKLPAASGGLVELPRVDGDELRTCFVAEPGKTFLVSLTDFRPATAGRVTLVLARARVEGAAGQLAAAAGAGDVYRAWNISAFLHLPWDDIHPPLLGLADPAEADLPSAVCPVCSGGEEPWGDAVVEWAKIQVAATVWEEPGRDVAILGDQLVVRAPVEVQDAIARALDTTEPLIGTNVSLESWLVAFPESEWLSRRDVLERPKGIPDALFDELLQLPEKGAARLVATSSALGRSGSPFYALRGRHAAFVADHDVEIAEAARAWDPVVESLNDGLLLNASVLQAADGLLRVGLRSEFAQAALEAALETGAEAGGAVQTPACTEMPMACDVQVADGKAFVAATAMREGAKGPEVWVCFVRARTLGEK